MRRFAASCPSILFALLSTSFGAAPAQDAATSRPVPFPAATADAMLRLRDGKGSVDDLRAVVAAEVAAGRDAAAAWWIELAEPDLASPKAPAPARAAITELKRESAKRRAPTTEDRALTAKVTHRAEALALQKNFE